MCFKLFTHTPLLSICRHKILTVKVLEALQKAINNQFRSHYIWIRPNAAWCAFALCSQAPHTHTRYYDMCALIFSPGILGQPEKCSMLLLIYRDLASNLLWCPLSRFCVAEPRQWTFSINHMARAAPLSAPKFPPFCCPKSAYFPLPPFLCERVHGLGPLYSDRIRRWQSI